MNSPVGILRKGQRLSIPELSSDSDFVIDDVLCGGMGVCVKIRTLKTGQLFALKGMLPNVLPDEQARSRFLKELDVWFAASSIDGVVEAFQPFEFYSQVFMASEWASGGDLFHALGSMTPIQKTKAILETVETLGLVYKQYKVIHRDLKPQNILLSSKGNALVSDWGLAKVYGGQIERIAKKDSLPSKDDLTMAGSCLGTALYMAPEQWLDAASVDCRADIYALGCIMFQMETGKPPFLAPDLMSLFKAHRFSPVPRLGGFLRRTSLGLENVIEKCLRKDPKDRYQSYPELIVGIQSALARRGLPHYHKPQLRTKRSLPGQGGKVLQQVISEGVQAPNNQAAFVEFEEIKPILEESVMLMGTGRYQEAIKLLEPIAVANLQILGTIGENWIDMPCDIVLNLAEAYSMTNQFEKANILFSRLNQFSGKPSEFFVNYSNCLIREEKARQALEVCENGLKVFSKDVALIGNQTMALWELGKESESIQSARLRLSLDHPNVHVYYELNCAYKIQTTRLALSDLSEWERIMRLRAEYIHSGLLLNPVWAPLRLARIDFFLEVDVNRAIDECQKLLDDKSVSGSNYRQANLAYVKCLKEFFHRSHDAKELVNGVNAVGRYLCEDFYKLCTVTEKRFIRDTYYFLMLPFVRATTLNKPKIAETVRYFTSDETSGMKEKGEYRNPVETARCFLAMGNREQAIRLLKDRFSPTQWLLVRVLASALQEKGDTSEAMSVAMKGVEAAPQSFNAWDTLSMIQKGAGLANEAQQSTQRADWFFKMKNDIGSRLLKTIHL